jgi:hypothetical protein
VCKLHEEKINMKTLKSLLEGERRFRRRSKEGKIGWALLWLMGVPVPVLVIFFLLRGCD